MGDPRSLPLEALRTLAKRQFPACVIVTDPVLGVLVYTLHGTGATEQEALQNALTSFDKMLKRGHMLRGMLNDILDDLKTPGMSRERHDNLQDSLAICETYLNDGVLSGSIGPLEVPRYTRELDELKRRVTARLGMAAQQAADHESAKNHAAKPTISMGIANDFEALLRRVPAP
jgi:hypothetical protein